MPSRNGSGQPWRLIVIDDDIDFAESLAMLLALEGHETRVAHSAAAATALLAEWPADVALVDIRLGSDDGVALVSEIHQCSPQSIVVMMTAYASLETAVEAIKAGAYDFLIKPFFPYDLDRTLARCFERLRLVAERDAAEARLRQAQRLDALGQLSGGVAHEFNNALAVILGNLQLLEERLASQPALKELVEDALGAVRSGMELTSRLLSHARGAPLHAEATDLASILPGTCRLLERTLGIDVAIVLDIAPSLPAVLVDRSQLEASLINLAINARDAMTDGGTLRIKARLNGRNIDLTLSDSGPGMSPEALAKATEPFFTTKPAGSGLGLGLAMVTAFASWSNGELILESAPGSGLDATIRLPTAADVPGPSKALHDDAPVPMGHSEMVLLVEDDHDVLRTLRRQLEHLKYRVTCAGSAEDATEALATNPAISAIISDVGLTDGQSGIELVRQALERRPDLASLLVTANAVNAPGTHLPGVVYLVKPVDLGTLARAVQSALQAREASSGAKT